MGGWGFSVNICNVRSYRAKTPLDLARDRGHYQVIRYLQYILQKRHNPNVTQERRRQDQIKLPEFVIEEVAEEEEEESLNIKLKQVNCKQSLIISLHKDSFFLPAGIIFVVLKQDSNLNNQIDSSHQTGLNS